MLDYFNSIYLTSTFTQTSNKLLSSNIYYKNQIALFKNQTFKVVVKIFKILAKFYACPIPTFFFGAREGTLLDFIKYNELKSEEQSRFQRVKCRIEMDVFKCLECTRTFEKKYLFK